MTRFYLILSLVALVLLRMAVGYHFFKEGSDKLAVGSFSAEPFLRSARGPLARFFESLIDDHDGRWRFCLTVDPETGHKRLDPTLSIAIWDDFLDRAASHYRFGDSTIEKHLQLKLAELETEIQLAESGIASASQLAAMYQLRTTYEEDLAKLAVQTIRSEEILALHELELRNWLEANRTALLAHFHAADREQGFVQDGASRTDVSRQLESLREQLQTIKQDRWRQRQVWSAEIEAIWDSYEREILDLLVESQLGRPPLRLHRPHAQENSRLVWINRIIPWFDVVVGVLLVVGLFTRGAALAGGLFLAAVIASQSPWLPGGEPIWFAIIELLVLVLLFGTGAGRFGGLDFFVDAVRRRLPRQENLVPAETL